MLAKSEGHSSKVPLRVMSVEEKSAMQSNQGPTVNRQVIAVFKPGEKLIGKDVIHRLPNLDYDSAKRALHRLWKMGQLDRETVRSTTGTIRFSYYSLKEETTND